MYDRTNVFWRATSSMLAALEDSGVAMYDSCRLGFSRRIHRL